MKKLFIICATAFMLTACSSVESKLDDAQKAINDGKFEKAEKILKEIKVEDLTPEQREKYYEVVADGAAEAIKAKAGEFMDAAGAAANKIMEEASNAADKLIEDASSAVDNFWNN